MVNDRPWNFFPRRSNSLSEKYIVDKRKNNIDLYIAPSSIIKQDYLSYKFKFSLLIPIGWYQEFVQEKTLKIYFFIV
jgi:hypothetical protein